MCFRLSKPYFQYFVFEKMHAKQRMNIYRQQVDDTQQTQQESKFIVPAEAFVKPSSSIFF